MSMIEADTGDGISMTILVNSVFTLSFDIPNLNLVITATSKDLSVVSREGNGKHILRVSNQFVDGFSSGNVPKANCAVPRGREAVAAITGQANLVHKVGMTSEHLGGLSPFDIFLVSALVKEFPLDESLITGARDEEFNFLSINLLFTDGKRSDPTTVA